MARGRSDHPGFPSAIPHPLVDWLTAKGPLETIVSLPEYLLDLPAEEAARLIALALLDRTAEAARRLGDPTDPTIVAVHGFASSALLNWHATGWTRDLTRAGQLEADDDAMDDLHRHLFTVLTAPSWDHGVAPAVDITLIGRFYERYADHAVALARRVVYIVTGRMPRPLVT